MEKIGGGGGGEGVDEVQGGEGGVEVQKGGVRIPRHLNVDAFWRVLEECCAAADVAVGAGVGVVV